METLDRIKQLINSKETCVLATVSDATPHCSLMAYASNADCSELYMATLKNTKKFANITREPAVSLLIDTREDAPPAEGLNKTLSLTVSGRFVPISDAGLASSLKKELCARHPRLSPLIQDPDAEIIRIKVDSFLFLDGPTDAVFVEV